MFFERVGFNCGVFLVKKDYSKTPRIIFKQVIVNELKTYSGSYLFNDHYANPEFLSQEKWGFPGILVFTNPPEEGIELEEGLVSETIPTRNGAVTVTMRVER